MQVIVDSSLGITVDNILDLPEVGIHSINLHGGNNITQSGESLLTPNPCDHPGEDTTWDCKTDNCSSCQDGANTPGRDPVAHVPEEITDHSAAKTPDRQQEHGRDKKCRQNDCRNDLLSPAELHNCLNKKPLVSRFQRPVFHPALNQHCCSGPFRHHPDGGCGSEGFGGAWCGRKCSMDKTSKNKGSLAGGIAVATLLAMVSATATAIAVVANSHSQQYKDCIAQSDVTSDQCSLLYPAQR